MKALTIRKKASNVIKFVDSLRGPYGGDDYEISFQNDDLVVKNNGSTRSYGYDIVTIIDETDTSAVETFASLDALILRLFELGIANFNTGGATSLTPDELAAIHAANSPDAGNPFATMADISGGVGTLSQTLTQGNTVTDQEAVFQGNGYVNTVNSRGTKIVGNAEYVDETQYGSGSFLFKKTTAPYEQKLISSGTVSNEQIYQFPDKIYNSGTPYTLATTSDLTLAVVLANDFHTGNNPIVSDNNKAVVVLNEDRAKLGWDGAKGVDANDTALGIFSDTFIDMGSSKVTFKSGTTYISSEVIGSEAGLYASDDTIVATKSGSNYQYAAGKFDYDYITDKLNIYSPLITNNNFLRSYSGDSTLKLLDTSASFGYKSNEVFVSDDLFSITSGNPIEIDAPSIKLNGKNIVAVVGGTYTATATATTTFTVSIGTTMPNTNYSVPQPGARNALSAVMCYITNKTTTSFDIVTVTALTGAVSWDWTLSPQ